MLLEPNTNALRRPRLSWREEISRHNFSLCAWDNAAWRLHCRAKICGVKQWPDCRVAELRRQYMCFCLGLLTLRCMLFSNATGRFLSSFWQHAGDCWGCTPHCRLWRLMTMEELFPVSLRTVLSSQRTMNPQTEQWTLLKQWRMIPDNWTGKTTQAVYFYSPEHEKQEIWVLSRNLLFGSVVCWMVNRLMLLLFCWEARACFTRIPLETLIMVSPVDDLRHIVLSYKAWTQESPD